MVEARFGQALTFKKLIEALKDLVTEVNLEASPEGLFVQAMDASHVALISLFLHREGFEHYECERDQSIGVSMNNLSKIIKCAENDDSIVFRVDRNASQLQLIFEGKKEDKISEFNLNLLTLDSEHLAIPEDEYSCIVNLSTNELAGICRELSQMSDTICFDVNKQRIVFSVSGDIGRGAITLKHSTSGSGTSINSSGNVNVSFAIRYLNLFCKSAAIASAATLSISEELPLIMKLEFSLGYLKYYLAPKVNDN